LLHRRQRLRSSKYRSDAARAIALGLALCLAGIVSAPAQSQVITEFTAGISPGATPLFIAAAPDGNLWFTELADRIGKITTAGVVTEYGSGISAGAYPLGIAVGPDGNLWFTEYHGDRIGKITPDGVVTEYSSGITAGASPAFIIAGPDGNLWFTEYHGNRIGRITTDGVVTEYSTGISAGALPEYITAGPDGNLWFTEWIANRIGKITPDGVVTEYATGITADATLGVITAGPDGNLWFTEGFAGLIGRITTAGVITEYGDGSSPAASPVGIAAGIDGNLWFTENPLVTQSPGKRIGRITTSGVIAEYADGFGTSLPILGIAAGPDGNLWFAEGANNGIGRFTIPRASMAIEYFDAGFDHYFFTASAPEIAKLDAGGFPGWARTGLSFGVFLADTPGTSNLCRFFSTAFGLKSSHFYTAFPGECDAVKGSVAWQYEGIVAALALPDISGACGDGLSLLYRIYNNGQGGAPNHRFTTDAAVRQQMILLGWIPEGYGNLGVAGCVPVE
jgi:streptogramin lyase